MDLQELYNNGYRRFEFSDGVVREPCSVKPGEHSQKLQFNVNDARIWYRNDGRPNICEDTYPKAVGGAGKSMNRREEIQQAIEAGISGSCVISNDADESELITAIMCELDDLAERWTDEETAEDLDKSIGESGVYEGMRVRTVRNVAFLPPGATGTVVHPDSDGFPGIHWDTPAYNDALRPHSYGDYCYHVYTGDIEEIT